MCPCNVSLCVPLYVPLYVPLFCVFCSLSQGDWIQEAKLTASDGAAGDRFGLSASIHGDTAIVGALEDDANVIDSGSAYVFVRNANGDWIQEAKLTASDGAAEDRFGDSVSIHDDPAIVGAPRVDYPGRNYLGNGDDRGAVCLRKECNRQFLDPASQTCSQ